MKMMKSMFWQERHCFEKKKKYWAKKPASFMQLKTIVYRI